MWMNGGETIVDAGEMKTRGCWFSGQAKTPVGVKFDQA